MQDSENVKYLGKTVLAQTTAAVVKSPESREEALKIVAHRGVPAFIKAAYEHCGFPVSDKGDHPFLDLQSQIQNSVRLGDILKTSQLIDQVLIKCGIK